MVVKYGNAMTWVETWDFYSNENSSHSLPGCDIVVML